MKKKKNMSKAVVLITIMAVMYIMPAHASNYTDTVFNFYFKSKPGISVTEPREKQDDTSVYMKCQSTTYPYTAHVEGTMEDLGITRYNLSGGHSYTFYSGTVCRMINYVYENHIPYASVSALRSYSSSYHATGVWSPDSI